ncbi:hypothetical protein EV401DRAFT_1454639 [Pisolithus croceorrhizus]|nr:hypothetical protein EV401DRAFT_1454639 [Pisolithus croceorrhizus]
MQRASMCVPPRKPARVADLYVYKCVPPALHGPPSPFVRSSYPLSHCLFPLQIYNRHSLKCHSSCQACSSRNLSIVAHLIDPPAPSRTHRADASSIAKALVHGKGGDTGILSISSWDGFRIRSNHRSACIIDGECHDDLSESELVTEFSCFVFVLFVVTAYHYTNYFIARTAQFESLFTFQKGERRSLLNCKFLGGLANLGSPSRVLQICMLASTRKGKTSKQKVR